MSSTDLLYLIEYDAGNGPERAYVTAGLVDDDDRIVAALPAYRDFVLDKEASIETQDDMRRMIDAHYVEQA